MHQNRNAIKPTRCCPFPVMNQFNGGPVHEVVYIQGMKTRTSE